MGTSFFGGGTSWEFHVKHILWGKHGNWNIIAGFAEDDLDNFPHVKTTAWFFCYMRAAATCQTNSAC